MLDKSNLQKIDFAKLYIEQKELSTFKSKSAKDWDEKAEDFNSRVFKSVYVDEFLKRVELGDAKTLLDVGCGPGTLGINLASKLEKVYCADFSHAMLECVEQNAKQRGLQNVQTIQKSFYDDWSDVPKCDILIASRCMEVKDLEKTLKLLITKAKQCYITFKTGGSFLDEDILNAMEQNITPKPDYIYLLNILYNLGIKAQLDFIPSENNRFKAKDAEEFVEKIRWSFGELTAKQEQRLKDFYENTYKYKKHEEFIYWAFVEFETP